MAGVPGRPTVSGLHCTLTDSSFQFLGSPFKSQRATSTSQATSTWALSFPFSKLRTIFVNTIPFPIACQQPPRR